MAVLIPEQTCRRYGARRIALTETKKHSLLGRRAYKTHRNNSSSCRKNKRH